MAVSWEQNNRILNLGLLLCVRANIICETFSEETKAKKSPSFGNACMYKVQHQEKNINRLSYPR